MWVFGALIAFAFWVGLVMGFVGLFVYGGFMMFCGLFCWVDFCWVLTGLLRTLVPWHCGLGL